MSGRPFIRFSARTSRCAIYSLCSTEWLWLLQMLLKVQCANETRSMSFHCAFNSPFSMAFHSFDGEWEGNLTTTRDQRLIRAKNEFSTFHSPRFLHTARRWKIEFLTRFSFISHLPYFKLWADVNLIWLRPTITAQARPTARFHASEECQFHHRNWWQTLLGAVWEISKFFELHCDVDAFSSSSARGANEI